MKHDAAKASVSAMAPSLSTAAEMPSMSVSPIRWLVSRTRGSAILLLMTLNTIVFVSPMVVIAPVKLASGRGWLRNACDRLLNAIAESWIAVNNWLLDVLTPTRWDIAGTEGLVRRAWYMLVANHQSWVDILVLQKTFNRRVPMLKFFIKQELIWMPLLGFAWWLLDFPFMKRAPRRTADGRRRPPTGDLNVALKACEKFKRLPVTVMNFVEGTRFTPRKQERQQSPYRRLLRPKCGGAAIVFQAMHAQLHAILDVTIVYPQGPPTYWELVCGYVPEIRVHVDQCPVDPELVGDYTADPDYRKRVQAHFNALWERKDARILDMEGR